MEDQNKLSLNDLAIAALRESAKWCLFLAIVGFIFIGLMIILGAFMSVAMSAMPSNVAFGSAASTNSIIAMKSYFGVLYILFAVLYFFPVYYLYKYAAGIKKATESGNNDVLSDALVNLKSHHKFLGIMTIVMIVVYILAFVGVIIFAAKFASAGRM
ncbi:DUF5362 family protein [Flavobacterium sp.]|uniref:DUF5362 family protein n=1 Tax=Flavobacterium sp. TaxID=239 RepID=UPI0025F4D39A|nr:DUF5362 family protein [Flavobacterium sp.]